MALRQHACLQRRYFEWTRHDPSSDQGARAIDHDVGGEQRVHGPRAGGRYGRRGRPHPRQGSRWSAAIASSTRCDVKSAGQRRVWSLVSSETFAQVGMHERTWLAVTTFGLAVAAASSCASVLVARLFAPRPVSGARLSLVPVAPHAPQVTAHRTQESQACVWYRQPTPFNRTRIRRSRTYLVR